MNATSHIIIKEVKACAKMRLLMSAGQLGVADISGLLFLKQKPGEKRSLLLDLLPEKYLKDKEVTDFIEYEKDMFLVACLEDENFYFINRKEKKTTHINSINRNYITLGMQMLPNYELQIAIIRDTRGVQLLNLLTGKAHQLLLAKGNNEN